MVDVPPIIIIRLTKYSLSAEARSRDGALSRPPQAGGKHGFAPRLKEGFVGALIMLGTLFSVIALTYWLVLRFDPEARRPYGRDGDE